MDTVEFFTAVLPRQGLKVLAQLVPFTDKKTGAVRDGWRYSTYQSFEAMAAAAQQFDAKGLTIFHACNAYGDWYEDEATGKKRLRTQENVVACRSLYDDIDIGKANCYPDRKVAMAAVKEMVAATHLPAPLVIYSGSGIHLYWPLTKDISPEAWGHLAVLKRRITAHLGLLVDRAIDCDLARVLRPVGTFNRKATPVEVVAKNTAKASDPDHLRTIMEQFIDANDVPMLSNRKATKANAFAAALENDYPDAYAEELAEQCQQIAWFRDTGAPYEPVWYLGIGALKHCVEGEAVIHEWSSKYDGYSESETQMKIAQWRVGPPDCDTFKAVAPERCKGCKHA